MKTFKLFVIFCAVSLFTACTAEKEWSPLFGEKLSEANYDAAIWKEVDGVLSAVEDASIWSKVEYENFELDLEFKNDKGTNSGVVVYCTDTENWIPNSVEIQIADDYCEKWGNSNPTWKCGAIFGHLAAKRDCVVNKPGEWNHMNIKCKGKIIDIVLNGEKITHMDMNLWTSGTVNPDGTEIPSWLPRPFATLPTKGYIGLQGKHGDALIWFRNVKVRPLM